VSAACLNLRTCPAAYLDHGHIIGQCNGLTEAGATLKWVFDPDAKKVADFVAKFPGVPVAPSFDAILADPAVKLVATAAIPALRGPIGCRVPESGRDYFTDKPPFTTLAQLDQAKRRVAATGKKFMVYFSERLHNESAMFATDLVAQGAVGRVLQVLGTHPDHPGFEAFGEASLLGNNGATNYVRVDWFTPKGLSTWGDGRLINPRPEGHHRATQIRGRRARQDRQPRLPHRRKR
jgi:predicted dehydrogenase